MLRVVIVDDQTEVRDKMIRIIDFEKYGVLITGTADNGIDAYRLIREKEPDIVLMDIELPGMSGLEVIEKVKSSGIPSVFIIISCHANFCYAKEALTLDVFDYLVKPFMPDELLCAIFRASKKCLGMKLQHNYQAPVVEKYWLDELRPADYYPLHIEQEIMQSVQQGDLESVKNSLDLFFSIVESMNQPHDISHYLLLLLFELLNLAKNNGFHEIDFDAINSHNGIKSLIFDLCKQITSRLSNKSLSECVVHRAKLYIYNNFAENISLDCVAKEVYVTPNYLSSLFPEYVGMTFVNFVQYIRIQKAKELIERKPHLKNYEIAENIGFSSDKYFSTVFHKITGITASQYRMKVIKSKISKQSPLHY